MSDEVGTLVKRLRSETFGGGALELDAADRIEQLEAAMTHIRDNGHWLGLYSIHKIATEAVSGKPFYLPANPEGNAK